MTLQAAVQAVRGTHDILPDEIQHWQRLEATFRTITARFGFSEIRTPVFEHTELFARGIGETTDIVGKEMYTFQDEGETSLTLRPEATAGIVRAAIQHTLVQQNPIVRLWTTGAMFRRERPQKGRQRQFHQFNAELLGSAETEADAEIIALAAMILQNAGLTQFELHVNSLGNSASRTQYRKALTDYFRPHIDAMSEESQKRLERNPLRILDSKSAADADIVKGAPLLTDFLDDESRTRFERVQMLLTALDVPFVLNARLVRGLDYYCHTAFEFVTTRLGAQNAIGGGGRYDGLFEQLGGVSTPGIGFALGIERLLLLLAEENNDHGKQAETAAAPDVYVIGLDAESRTLALKTAHRLRLQGFVATTDAGARSMKAQMRDANRTNTRFVLIIGEAERLSGNVILKQMATGEQQECGIEDTARLAEVLSGR
jgi:histidyl-tRNA synthetase